MQLIKPDLIILVTGACGRIGTELVRTLRHRHGKASVIATDIRPESIILITEGRYKYLDVMDKPALGKFVVNNGVTHIYHLAAMLSAKGENDSLSAWNTNVNGLLNVLEIAAMHQVKQVFWPSSIAVFGPASPRSNCGQDALPDPASVYGISKHAGEYWCRYYYERFGLDVRSLRYPGLIGYSLKAGGDTTDYAAEIFHQAVEECAYTCFLKGDTSLPMMYMPDAVRAMLELMDAPLDRVRKVTSYNVAAMSFTPLELAAEVQTYKPGFRMTCKPDYRQKIADTWPSSIEDRQARQDWGWMPHYNIFMMTMDMFYNLQPRK